MLRGDVRRARRILVAPTRQAAPHQLVALRSVSTNAIPQHHDFDYRVDVVSKQPYDGIAKLKRRPDWMTVIREGKAKHIDSVTRAWVRLSLRNRTHASCPTNSYHVVNSKRQRTPLAARSGVQYFSSS
jgi:hypothetical protein